jgi:hypothetical protein
MKKLLWLALTAMLSVAAASPCFAADSPWNGTWQENLAKSKLTGSTVVITAKGSGYHFSNGPVSYDFACDGKTYTTTGTATISCISTPDGGFDFMQAANGKAISKQHRTFSADGKVMTNKTTVTSPDGTTSTTEQVRTRKSGTTGLIGEWVDTKLVPTQPAVHTIAVKGDMIHVEILHSKTVVDAKLDGSDGKVSGPLVSPGSTQSYKAASPTKLLYTAKLNGKVTDEGSLTLSADGKSYTDVRWYPEKPTEKTVQIFEKQ